MRIIVKFETLGNFKMTLIREFKTYDEVSEYMVTHDVSILEVEEIGGDVKQQGNQTES